MPAYHPGMDDDLVFRALAASSRRRLLDRLHAHDGQTLRELCEGLRMSRQAVAGHLRVLEGAGLVASRRAGREKHHFLLQEPIQRLAQGWIHKFEYPRPSALPPDSARH